MYIQYYTQTLIAKLNLKNFNINKYTIFFSNEKDLLTYYINNKRNITTLKALYFCTYCIHDLFIYTLCSVRCNCVLSLSLHTFLMQLLV